MVLKTVDEYLGPGEKRFFAAGYRRVGHRFGAVEIEATGEMRTEVSLEYPGNWSKRAAGDLRPHLSTIDAILLGAAMGEAYLIHALRPSADDRRRMWIRSMTIKAGRNPHEELAALPVRTTLVSSAGGVSLLRTLIGDMRVQCELVHGEGEGAGEPVAAPGRYASLTDLAGPPRPRYYGEAFKRRTQVITTDGLDIDALVASATVDLVDQPPGAGDQGLAAAYRRAPTMVDCFAAALQLAQILLYQLDGLSRRDSNTLWMRSTELRCAGPAGADDDVRLRTALTRPELLKLNGAAWRTARIEARLGAIDLHCAVAHQLPER